MGHTLQISRYTDIPKFTYLLYALYLCKGLAGCAIVRYRRDAAVCQRTPQIVHLHSMPKIEQWCDDQLVLLLVVVPILLQGHALRIIIWKLHC